MQAVKRVRSRYPLLAIIVRAHSRTDAYEYAEMGVPAVREVFGSALEAASRTLKSLGFAETETIVQRFKEYDEAQIARMAPFRDDMKQLIALTEQGRLDIAQLLAAEIHQGDPGGDEQRGEGEVRAERL